VAGYTVNTVTQIFNDETSTMQWVKKCRPVYLTKYQPIKGDISFFTEHYDNSLIQIFSFFYFHLAKG